MDDWFTTLALTDELNVESSGVFKAVKGTSVDGYRRFRCQLCSPRNDHDDELTETFLKAHLKDPLHVQRASVLLRKRNAVLGRFEWSLQYFRDMHYYCCPSLESAICRYIFVDNKSGKGVVLERVKELKRSDPMVHLELALWKAACELNPPDDIYNMWELKEWLRQGWKELKPDKRRDPMTGITTLVAPFLGLKKKET